MYMYNNFIHSSVDGHLDCFHVLAIVNSPAMNKGIHMSFSILVSSGYMPRSGIAGSYDDIVPSFLRNFHNIFHSGLSIYIPTNSAEAFPFLHILSSIYWCRLFDDGHSDWCEAVLICVFLIMGNVEHLFMYLIVICMSSVEKCLFSVFPTF